MFHQPTSIDEALALKAQLGREASFIAGGTDLVVGVRKGRRAFGCLIDLSHVSGLDAIETHGERLRIGAMVRHAALEGSHLRALADACATVGGPQIRNLGTIGGQLHTASPAGDVSVALLGLQAEVELASLRGSRCIPLHELFLGPGRTSLADDELIAAVWVASARRSSFYKLGKRDAVAISLIMGAASLDAEGRDLALALGCVAPVPLRLRSVEAHLATRKLDAQTIAEAGELAFAEVAPISDHRGGADYRRAMARSLTVRLLSQLAGLPEPLQHPRAP